MRDTAALSRIGAVAGTAGFLLLAAADVARMASPGGGIYPVLTRAAAAGVLAGVGGLTWVAWRGRSTQAVVGGVLAVAGTLGLFMEPALLARPTMMPAVLFPLGLFLIAAAVVGSPVLPRRGAALLAAGAVLFPLGHGVDAVVAVLGGDLVLLAAFGALAPALWNPAGR